MKGEVRPGYKQTEVGVIPVEWQSEVLAKVLAVVGGGTPSTSIHEFWDGMIPWVSAGDVSQAKGRYVLDTMDHISELGLSSCPARILPKGTVVIIARGATTGRMAQLGSDMAFNQTCYGLRAAHGLDQDYLYYAMQYSIGSTDALTYGTIFRTITTQSFQQWRIPVPTLAEQQAIAEALGDVDVLIGALDRLIAKKRAIKQGAMQELLTGRRRLPGFDGEWESKSIGSLFQFLGTANNPRSDLTPFGAIEYLHYGDVHTKWKTFLDCERASLPLIDADTVRGIPFLEDGDLVMVDASEDYEGVGVSLEIKNASGRKIVAGLHTLLLRANKADLADGFKGYLQYIPSLKLELIKAATGISVYGLLKRNIEGIQVLLPNVDEQTAIAAILSDMDAEIAALERRRDKTKLLKQGMMQELLTGRIRLL